MNILIHGPFADGLVDNIMAEMPMREVYSVEFPGEGVIKNSGASLLDFRKVNYGNFPDFESTEALSGDFVYEMRHCEQVVLRMMDRFNFDHIYGYDERKRIYLRHLRYWNHFLGTRDIGYYVCPGIPHQIQDYILYELCKMHKIPTLLFHPSQINQYVTQTSDIWYRDCQIKENFDQTVKQYTGKKVDASILGPGMSRQWRELKLCGKAERPYYVEVQKWLVRKFGWRGRLRNVLRRTMGTLRKNPGQYLSMFKEYVFWRRQIQKLDGQLRLSLYNRQYKNLSKDFDVNLLESLDYIYVPLHSQPEAATSPLGGSFVDQQLMIDILLQSTPNHIKLLVKEHPIQFGLGRGLNFFKDMTTNPRVQIVPTNIDTFHLIEHAAAVASCTGTAMWEGLYHQKPALVFGSVTYDFLDGVYKIDSVDDCRNAWQAIRDGETPKERDLLLLLKSLESSLVYGYTSWDLRPSVDISEEENTSRFVALIVDWVREQGSPGLQKNSSSIESSCVKYSDFSPEVQSP